MLHAYQKPLEGSTIGIVFGSFAPLHQGHLDLIMQAKIDTTYTYDTAVIEMPGG